MDNELPDSTVLKFCVAYQSILFDEYYKLNDKLDQSIKSINISSAKSNSEKILRCVTSLPSFNYELLGKRDSAFYKKLPRINPRTFEYDRHIYQNAITLSFISNKLFGEDLYYLGDNIPGINPLIDLNPPLESTIERYNEQNLPIYEFVQKEVFISIADKAIDFGDYFFENNMWEYAEKSFDISKRFYRKYINNDGWSYLALSAAYNEGLSYFNDRKYTVAYEKFNRLLSEVPDVDEYMANEHKKIIELLKKRNPELSSQKLKPIKQLIKELKLILNN